MSGHYLTSGGKRFIVNDVAARLEPKLKIGLIKLPNPLPQWGWLEANIDRLLEWGDEAHFRGYKRRSIGKLKWQLGYGSIDGVTKRHASWKNEGYRAHQFDAAFITTRDEDHEDLLLSVDVFYRRVTLYNGGSFTYSTSGSLYRWN